MSLQDQMKRPQNGLAADLHIARNGMAIREREGHYEITVTRAHTGFTLEVIDLSQTGLRPEKRIYQNSSDAARAFTSKARRIISQTAFSAAQGKAVALLPQPNHKI